jgi:S1-C subfamily serine protease
MERKLLAIVAVGVLIIASGAGAGHAQNLQGVPIPSPVAPPLPPAGGSSSDATLEVAPRIIPSPPPPSENQENAGSQFSSNVFPPLPAHRLPYLGITVRPAMVRFHRQDVHGLEIVGVDANSPAERAGIRTPTDMTTIGATGETAGYMLGPLGNLVAPLLQRTGQLGDAGDLLVAVDDRRVSSPDELYRALERLSPGDTIWLTVMRITPKGAPTTQRIPVVLAAPRS